jgi:hypothetical protein
MLELRIPTHTFRSTPAPNSPAKFAFFYARAADISDLLWEWRDVNPREVSDKTAVYDAIVDTLTDDPDRFFERNRGLTIAAEDVQFDDKKKAVMVRLSNRELHGLVDGGHTLHAILQVQKAPPENWPAFVFVKVMTGIEPDQIAEIAGGLNRSQQVDLKSLENLKSHFDRLKAVLADKPYANKIAYKMNEDQPIDVREVLYYLAVFDRTEFNDNQHPTRLFGRKEGIVRRFADQAAGKEGAGDSFNILISRAPDILALRDLIEKRVASRPELARYKAGKNERIGSKKHRKTELHFLNEQVDRRVPLGWIMPMLGAFRANVIWNDPPGTFAWQVPNQKLLDAALDKLVSCVVEIHQREASRPEYVGRSATAWRLCYETVQNSILQFQLDQAKGLPAQ